MRWRHGEAKGHSVATRTGREHARTPGPCISPLPNTSSSTRAPLLSTMLLQSPGAPKLLLSMELLPHSQARQQRPCPAAEVARAASTRALLPPLLLPPTWPSGLCRQPIPHGLALLLLLFEPCPPPSNPATLTKRSCPGAASAHTGKLGCHAPACQAPAVLGASKLQPSLSAAPPPSAPPEAAVQRGIRCAVPPAKAATHRCCPSPPVTLLTASPEMLAWASSSAATGATPAGVALSSSRWAPAAASRSCVPGTAASS